jgi:UDP-glucose 4-epimerase
MLLGTDVKKILLTGGAGFIGSHVVEILAPQGYDILLLDNLSNGRLEYIEAQLKRPNVKFIEGDATDQGLMDNLVRGRDLVWHLAANTDIIGSHNQPQRDLHDCTVATFVTLNAMRKAGVRDIIFASTGAVYGSLCLDNYVTESIGPLLPVSSYGAGKVASEAFIASFCHVYGLHGWIYRFGNVLGARMTHGVIFDFLNRLRENSAELLIMGDGRQEKNYFLVEECISGMAYGYLHRKLDENNPCEVYNLGTTTVTRVVDLAAMVVEELDLKNAAIRIQGTARAWPGDQPRVHFSVDKMTKLGWVAQKVSDEAVRIAIRRMLDKPGSREFVR